MKWVGHLQANGFEVQTRDLSESGLREINAKYGITNSLVSCHTAVVNGYVIEGHVPADLIKRLLKERPAVTGLAVPGMPDAAPGMEGPNPLPYDVLAFDRKGHVRVYARR